MNEVYIRAHERDDWLYMNKRVDHFKNKFSPMIKPAMKTLIGNADYTANDAWFIAPGAQKFLSHLFASFQNDLMTVSGTYDAPGLPVKSRHGKNKHNHPSVIIDEMSLAIPVYGEDRGTGVDYLTPSGKTLTSQQKQTASFIDKLLRTLPASFKRGLLLSFQHPNWTSQQLMTQITGGNIPQQIIPVIPKTSIGQTIATYAKGYVGVNHWQAHETSIAEFGYIVGQRLHDLMNDMLVFKSYKNAVSYNQFLTSLNKPFLDHLQNSGLVNQSTLIPHINNSYFSKFLRDTLANYGAVMFGVSGIPVTATDRETLYLSRNSKGHLTLWSPFTKTHYAFFSDQRDKDSFVAEGTLSSALQQTFLNYLMGKDGQGNIGTFLGTNNIRFYAEDLSHLNIITHLSHVAYHVFRDYMESLTTSKSAKNLLTRDQFHDRMDKAFAHHLGLTGTSYWIGNSTRKNIMDTLSRKLSEQAFGLGGSSVALLLKDHPELMQSWNMHMASSLLSRTTELSYPALKDERYANDAFLPRGYNRQDLRDTLKQKVKEYLTINKILEKNKFEQQEESLTSLGHVVDALAPLAVNYTQEDFQTTLTHVLLEHVRLTGTEDLVVNSTLTFKNYVKDLLSSRLFGQAFVTYNLGGKFLKNERSIGVQPGSSLNPSEHGTEDDLFASVVDEDAAHNSDEGIQRIRAKS